MKKEFMHNIESYNKRQHRKRRWQKTMIIMASIVVFCTVYQLILPAITMEKDSYFQDEFSINEENQQSEALSEDFSSEEVWQDQTITEEAMPDETISEEIVPDDVVFEDSVVKDEELESAEVEFEEELPESVDLEKEENVDFVELEQKAKNF